MEFDDHYHAKMGDRAREHSKNGPSLYHIVCRRRVDFDDDVQCLYRARTRLYHTFQQCLYNSRKGEPPLVPKCHHESLYGSIFNLEFSPLDDCAYAVSSNKMVLTFDPRTHSPAHKPGHVLKEAHSDCVNCISFLEGNLFATCSDDKTIKIWDRRNLFTNVAHLKGHTSWVKNIEYDPKSNLLFSIAFYDGVRSWDMNKLEHYNDSPAVTDNLLFKLQDPVRMRLAPDMSKMFISMRRNLCLVLERFDGASVGEIGTHISEMLKKPDWEQLHDQLRQRKRNRPSLHTMSGFKGRQSFRAVMSADFHPSSDFIALRHLDIRNETLHLELTTIYDLRSNDYCPYLPFEWVNKNYIKYIDEWSPDETIDYIKEISFSKDGRVLASPSEEGVRLFAVNQECTPIDLYFDERFHSEEKSLNSLDLDVVQSSLGHSSPVLTCKFAHHDLLLGTGCLRGQVAFHKPQV